jgi:lipopolysaccharide transport system permease protein
MFATPVVYTTASVMAGRPEWLRSLYALNPMAGVVEGFRFALLGGPAPAWGLVAGSAAIVAVLLTGGLFFFRRMERSFADLV